MAEESQSGYVVFGPSKVGKTALLAALQHAVAVQAFGTYGMELRLFPRSESAANVFSLARRVAETGRFPFSGSSEVIEYRFDLEVKWRRMFVLPRTFTASFRMLDGPGYALFETGGPAADIDRTQLEEFRRRLIAMMRTAKGVILCLDATLPAHQPMAFFCDLPRILGELGMDRLPYERFAICLNKADAFFARHGSEARRRVQATPSEPECRRILTSPGMRTLGNYRAPRTRFGSCWTSVYGFVEETGRPNFDPEGDCLLVSHASCSDATAAIETWIPFQVLDPFVWLATGQRWGMELWEP